MFCLISLSDSQGRNKMKRKASFTHHDLFPTRMIISPPDKGHPSPLSSVAHGAVSLPPSLSSSDLIPTSSVARRRRRRQTVGIKVQSALFIPHLQSLRCRIVLCTPFNNAFSFLAPNYVCRGPEGGPRQLLGVPRGMANID